MTIFLAKMSATSYYNYATPTWQGHLGQNFTHIIIDICVALPKVAKAGRGFIIAV
jgi:hypothetical protein